MEISGDLITDGVYESDYYRTMPIGIVVKCHENFLFDPQKNVMNGELTGVQMKKGDIFGISDIIGLSMLNPKNSAYHNNHMTKSNAEMEDKQKAPSRWIHPIHEKWGGQGFVIDKACITPSIRDSFTFLIHCGQVKTLVENKKLFLEKLSSSE